MCLIEKKERAFVCCLNGRGNVPPTYTAAKKYKAKKVKMARAGLIKRQ